MAGQLIPTVDNDIRFLEKISYNLSDLTSNAMGVSRIAPQNFKTIRIPDDVTHIFVSVFIEADAAFDGDTNFAVVANGDFQIGGPTPIVTDNLAIAADIITTDTLSLQRGNYIIGPRASNYLAGFTVPVGWDTAPPVPTGGPVGFWQQSGATTPNFSIAHDIPLPRLLTFWVGSFNILTNAITTADWSFNVSGLSDL